MLETHPELGERIIAPIDRLHAIRRLREGAGTQLDPVVVGVALRVLNELRVSR